jgi:hypothetical protein
MVSGSRKLWTYRWNSHSICVGCKYSAKCVASELKIETNICLVNYKRNTNLFCHMKKNSKEMDKRQLIKNSKKEKE